MKRRTYEAPLLADPFREQHNAHQTFLLALSVLAALPLLQGRAASAVIERELTDPAIIGWGFLLLCGSMMALLGEYWPGRAWTRNVNLDRTWTGLVLERGGLGLVAGAAAIYAGVVFLSTTGSLTDVGYIVAIQLAYAGSCGWRCWQITRRLHWIRAVRAAAAADTGQGG